MTRKEFADYLQNLVLFPGVREFIALLESDQVMPPDGWKILQEHKPDDGPRMVVLVPDDGKEYDFQTGYLDISEDCTKDDDE